MELIVCGFLCALAAVFASWYSATALLEQPMQPKQVKISCALLGTVGLACGLLLGGQLVYVPNIARMVVALGALSGAAVCDIREKRIPNLFYVLMLAAFVLLSGTDLLMKEGSGFSSLLGGFLSGVILFGLMALFRGVTTLIIHKAGIGWGDVKIIGAMGCLIGLRGTVAALFLGQLIMLFTVLVLLALRKVGLKDGVAFAPFLLVGFLLSVCLGMY